MIKRILLSILLTLISFPSEARRQVVFPLTIVVAWDLNAAIDAVTKYTIIHNVNTPVDVALTSCTATGCEYKLILTAEGPHTVSVTSTNQWGTSLPASVTFTARAPGRSGNIQIRVVR